MLTLAELLERSAAEHNHLCPRQVLGVRMGIVAAAHFQLDLPQTSKRLLAIVETDGCFADGVAAATGCTVGHRTMRVVDFGKVSVTFVDTKTQEALRIRPRLDARLRAETYALDAQSRWHTMLDAYQIMPQDELLEKQVVRLNFDVADLISRAGIRTNCDVCGEEIINEREIVSEGRVLCGACAGNSYYHMQPSGDTIMESRVAFTGETRIAHLQD